MICDPCKAAADISGREGTDDLRAELHNRCKGTTHCDCQHRKTTQVKGPDGKTYSAPEGVTGIVIR